MKNIYIVAQEFLAPGNCGALARSMKNFNMKNMVMLNPRCDYLSKEAMDRATHAKDILKNAKVMKTFDEITTKYDYVIGTTAMIGKAYNVPRNPVIPEELAKKLSQIKSTKKIAIVFGREDKGLTNEEVRKCDFTVTILTSKKYPTMNVSHAATIILYEIFKAQDEEKLGEYIQPASGKEKRVLLGLIEKAIDRLEFKTEEKKETQRRVWKRTVGKAMLNSRELFALCGFFKKIK